MACVKLFMYFLFQITFVFSTAEKAAFPRSSYFSTRVNKQLKGYAVKQFDSSSSRCWTGTTITEKSVETLGNKIDF